MGYGDLDFGLSLEQFCSINFYIMLEGDDEIWLKQNMENTLLLI